VKILSVYHQLWTIQELLGDCEERLRISDGNFGGFEIISKEDGRINKQ
jgi:hypothetical protein